MLRNTLFRRVLDSYLVSPKISSLTALSFFLPNYFHNILQCQATPLRGQGNVKVQGMCIFFLIMPSHIVWISGRLDVSSPKRFKMVYIDGAYDSKG